MELENLIIELRERLQKPLPGSQAHDEMRAVPVGNLIPNFNHKAPPKLGSVIIMLHEEEGQIKFPLIKRPQYLGAHSNQISLPGGKAELGENPIDTALREAEEEVGVDRTTVNVIGKLSPFFVIPSNFMVTPVIATASNPVFKPDSREVSKILFGSVQGLLKEDSVKVAEILAANTYKMRAPHFEFEGEIVWGATAMMLNELRFILTQT